MGRSRVNAKPRNYCAEGEQYARQIVAGEIPACEWVRLACQRQLDDLEREDFRWRFDEEFGNKVCRFLERLPHVKGRWKTKNIRLEPWQCFFITVLFGWVDDEDIRRFRKALIVIPRKNAKSTICAGLALFLLCADGEPGAEIYSAAVTRDQAKVAWGAAQLMVKRSIDMQEYFGIEALAHSIVLEHEGSFYKPLSRDADSLEGLNPHAAVVDELHAHKTREVFDVLDEATGSRRQPLIFMISTEGDSSEGVFAEQVEYGQQVLRGGHDDDSFFSLFYTIDAKPYDVILQSLSAFERLENDCTCNDVQPTQIESFWREACAKHAITPGTGNAQNPNNVRTIPTDQSSELGAYAEAATNNSFSTETLSAKRKASRGAKNGHPEIESESRNITKNGEASRDPRGRLLTTTGSSNTESHGQNTTEGIPSKKDDAESAQSFKRIYALITATQAVKSAGFSARNATQQSLSSEILRRVYYAHSPTCGARNSSLSDDGRLVIHCGADDWTNPESWYKANPNLGVSVFEQDMEIRCRQAIANADSQASFLTKRLNVRVGAGNAFFNMLAWGSVCQDATLKIEDFYGQPCVIHLDLASKRDLTAKLYTFRRGDEYVVFGKYYLPEDVMIPGMPNYDFYRGWAKTGKIIVNDGNRTDYTKIELDAIQDMRDFRLIAVGVDPLYNAEQLTQRLKDIHGLPMQEVPHNVPNFSEPMKTLDALIVAGKIKHNGDPVMAWGMGNTVAKRDAKDNVYPRKTRDENKIDPAVALIANLSLQMRMKDEPQWNFEVIAL